MSNRPWIKTNHGYARFQPFELVYGNNEDLLRDMNYSLLRIYRCLGRMPWCVADHCLLVADILRADGHDERMIFHGLMHDAHEAFVGDVPYPVTRILGPEFEELKTDIDHAIYYRLGVEPPNEEEKVIVRAADDRAFLAEFARFISIDSKDSTVPKNEHGWDVLLKVKKNPDDQTKADLQALARTQTKHGANFWPKEIKKFLKSSLAKDVDANWIDAAIKRAGK